MRLAITLLAALIAAPVAAADRPLVEEYLHSGKLQAGQRAIKAELRKTPGDDQLRFSLAVIQLVRGVEGLGQSLHEYGLKTDVTNAPFLRMPVPENPDPSEISYQEFGRMLERFRRDLVRTEATLAEIPCDEEVKLTLRLAEIRLDFNGDGEADDRFLDILRRIMRGQDFEFLNQNPEFKVAFDRGDVLWLRSYCHLLTGMLDIYLSAQTEEMFHLTADQFFARPKKPFEGDREERYRQMRESQGRIAEPHRLSRARKSFVTITELNHESWKYIRAETDDDYEWLPNPKQTGVLGLPVEDQMIDSWLAVMTEIGHLLKGERTMPLIWYGANNQGKGGMNLKIMLDRPPERFDNEFFRELPEEYITDDPHIDIFVIFRFLQLFNNTTAVGYAAWFN